MRCPYCGNKDTQVKDSRAAEDNQSIRRRRACTACGGRFTTFERVQLRELSVLKRNGRTVPFDRDKLYRSIRIACRKRKVGEERIDQLISGIVRQLEQTGESIISTDAVGALVMDGLKMLDEVAYVRFASVYRDFREAADFENVLDELSDKTETQKSTAIDENKTKSAN